MNWDWSEKVALRDSPLENLSVFLSDAVARVEYSSAISKVDSCNHETEFRIFDYVSDEEICSNCGKVVGMVKYSPLDHFWWHWEREKD